MKWLICGLLVVMGATKSVMAQQRYDVIFTEIFCDPTPAVGLPEVEFVEIRNRSEKEISLINWKLQDGGSISVIPGFDTLKPGEYLILCSKSAAPQLNVFGRTIGLSSFPSLSNEGEMLVLRDQNDQLIHSVEYRSSWYENEFKSKGGWSLEMIDENNFCSGISNWAASIDSHGGTPGKVNSTTAVNPDELCPVLLRSIMSDSTTALLFFDEVINLQGSTFGIQNNQVLSSFVVEPHLSIVELKLQEPIKRGTVKTIEVNGIRDCSGNQMLQSFVVRTGLPAEVYDTAIIINEVLFNPVAGGSDYVEIFNRSDQIFDLSFLMLANKTITGSLDNSIRLSEYSQLFFPGDHLAFTTDSLATVIQYSPANYSTVRELASLPSMPDDKGSICIAAIDGRVIDQLQYDKNWHFPLLNDQQGVSLEKINPDVPGNSPVNWTSASSLFRYGTPGTRNSQQAGAMNGGDALEISPKVFSPDNDGFDDFCIIKLKMPNTGSMFSIRIYDTGGRRIRTISNNLFSGNEATARWDGLDDKGRPSLMGVYIVIADTFDLTGHKKRSRSVVTIGYKS